MPSFSLYLAFSGWSADWHANLLLLKDYHFSGKVEEKVIILACVDVHFGFDEAILTKEAQGIPLLPALTPTTLLSQRVLLLLPKRPLVLLKLKERTLGGTAKGPLPKRGQVQGQGQGR